MSKYIKLVVYVPASHTNIIRQVLAENGAGKIGNYDSCSFSIAGIGRFRPGKNSNPTIGKTGYISEVSEERIEVVMIPEILDKVVLAVKKAHPYEKPAIEWWEVNLP